jgi:hypothetical protein
MKGDLNMKLTAWQRVLLYAIVALACLVAVMIFLMVSATWETRQAEAGISSSRTVTHHNNFWVEDYFTVDDQSAETVSANEQIDPAGSYQPLTASANVTAGLTVGSGGDFLCLTNVATYTIVITDQTTVALAGNCSLGQYDSLFLLCDGTRWVELGRSNN